MSAHRFSWSQQIKGHRTIYRFGGTWVQVLLGSVPWVNLLILFCLLLGLEERTVMNPGVVLDLPSEPIREGTYKGLTTFLIMTSGDAPNTEDTIAFFDDERYLVRNAEQMELFAARVKSRLAAGSKPEILLMADTRVPQGDVIHLVNIAREAGLKRVNVAETPKVR